MSLNHQMAMQAQAQQLSASQAQAQAAYMQNIHQQQQTQHHQQQQILQRQQMMQQLHGGGPSPSDVRIFVFVDVVLPLMALSLPGQSLSATHSGTTKAEHEGSYCQFPRSTSAV